MMQERAQAGQRFDDQWEAAGEVVAEAAVEPHPLTILAGDDVSCSHAPPDGSVWVRVGKHGAMKPLGRVRGRASMLRQ
jgi:hypothetical protein